MYETTKSTGQDANYIGLLVWKLTLGSKEHGDKTRIFSWQWEYFQYVWDSET